MRVVQKIADRLLRRIMLGSGVAVLELSDEKKTRKAQLSLLSGMTRDGINNPEPYGLSARPHKGALVYWLALGGDVNRLTALIASDPRYRPTDLQEGEVCIYTDEGDEIRLKRGREISVTSGARVTVTSPLVHVVATTKVTLETPLVEATQDMSVGGNLSVAGNSDIGGDLDVAGNATATVVNGLTDVTFAGTSAVTHKHSNGTDPQGNTGEPI